MDKTRLRMGNKVSLKRMIVSILLVIFVIQVSIFLEGFII
ncbi:hypothetical protein CPR19088_GLDEOEPO_01923 [Companilactobacillus paralimentarius]